jgi:hypothetical protein
MQQKQKRQPAWLPPALDYVQDWLAFQVERFRQPRCTVATARDGDLVGEYAFGHADLRRGERMTTRHRFRIASHSKSFTASGILLLREQGRLGLDDPIGRYVRGLHKGLAEARIAELLSHGAGVMRDGPDSGQLQDRRPFVDRDELMAELARKRPLEPGVQLKYSNHGAGGRLRGEPARHDPAPLARRVQHDRLLVRARHDDERAGRQGMVRALRQPAGVRLAHFAFSRRGFDDQRAVQCAGR